jgi:hypothetical protein
MIEPGSRAPGFSLPDQDGNVVSLEDFADRRHSNRSLVLVEPDGTVGWSYATPTPLEIPGANLIFDALDRD